MIRRTATQALLQVGLQVTNGNAGHEQGTPKHRRQSVINDCNTLKADFLSQHPGAPTFHGAWGGMPDNIVASTAQPKKKGGDNPALLHLLIFRPKAKNQLTF
ncbi:hypothetical protein JCM17961_21860 [Endothiovibrio diazotrophicus]